MRIWEVKGKKFIHVKKEPVTVELNIMLARGKSIGLLSDKQKEERL
jgi:hypothetical protein